MALESAFLYRHLNHLFLVQCFSAEAGLAFAAFCDDFSFASAGIAILLDLLIHSGAHLEHLEYSALAFAAGACPDSLSALALAALAASGALVGDLEDGAIVGLLEGDLECLFCGFYLLHLSAGGGAAASPSEEHVHEVCAVGLRALAAVLIVDPAFFWI